MGNPASKRASRVPGDRRSACSPWPPSRFLPTEWPSTPRFDDLLRDLVNDGGLAGELLAAVRPCDRSWVVVSPNFPVLQRGTLGHMMQINVRRSGGAFFNPV
jgi:hypothetical protein